MHSVQFDSTELVSSTYHLRYAQDHSAPIRNLETIDLSNEDGSVVVSEKYGHKIITVKGYISAANPAALQTAVDTFKELFSRKNKNLDITPDGGSTRRYVANCVNHTLIGDYYNRTFLPYEAEFLVASGVGKDTSLTAALNAVAVSTNPYSSNFTLAGSARPKPIISLIIGAGWSNAKGVKYELTNGSMGKIIVNRSGAWSNTDVLEIDIENKTVEYETIEVPFYRSFPEHLIGQNNFTITVADIMDEGMDVSKDNFSSSLQIHGNNWIAQSFMVTHTDDTYQGLYLVLSKEGSPPNPLVIEVQTDTNGAPSGSEVTNATFSIAAADVGAGSAWELTNSTNRFTLSANTRYWIVIKTTDGDASNCYDVYYSSAVSDQYGKGNKSDSADGGSTWTDDTDATLGFKVLFGGKVDASNPYTLDVDYYKRYL